MPKKKPEHTDRDHRECGGSGAHRWTRCTGSVFLARKAGPQPASKAAIRGTETHELAEMCVEDFLNHKLLGTDPEERYSAAKNFYDEEQIAAVEVYRDYIWNDVLENSITNKAWGLEDLMVHAKCDKIGGIADFWAAHVNDKAERVLHIVDFKNGTDPVDIKHEQFICYGVCMRSMLREDGKDIDRLVVHCVQPNSVNGKPTAKKSYTPKQMDVHEEKFLKAVHKIYVDNKATFKLGHWCKWCPGQSLCEKYGKKTEMDTGLSLLAPDIELPSVASLTAEQAVAIALNEANLKSLIKACKGYVIGQHMEGKPLAGCKVVQSKPRRALPKNTDPLEARLKKEGLKETEIFNRKLKGIGELEKLLGDKKKLLEKFVEFGKPTASVVPEDDPRPAATDLTDLLTD
jgi:hypothetical protein